jgi:hypothetical protein
MPRWLKKIWGFIWEWWGVMSGALSIPFAALALFKIGSPILFCSLAYIALWVMIFSQYRQISVLKSRKKPTIALYDDLEGLAKRGDGMMERFKKNEAPTEEEFNQWDNELITLAGRDTTISLRNRLRAASNQELTFNDAADLSFDIPKPHWDIAEKLLIKLKIIREAMKQLHKEDTQQALTKNVSAA